ncbi:tyrosine-type recombinase/integrase [Photobacterium swingsii]|uniref:tyrosine-type recombinase/integrase n=1 Tax=Photobacterium swingsii TaxID=680026 RepID=UPI00352FCC47
MQVSDIRFNQQAFFPSTIPLKISDAQIKKHIRDQRVRQLKDVRCSLYLRFNAKRDGGTWWYYRYEGSKQYPYRIGTYPATHAKDIMEVVSATTVQIAQGKAVGCNKFETVDQLIEWHVKRQHKMKSSSKERLANLRSMADRHLIGTFHGEPLPTLDHDTIDSELIQPMLSEGYSISYVKAMFNLLKSAYSTANRLKLIAFNPIADVKFKDSFPENFSLTKAQIKGCRLNADQLPQVLAGTENQPEPARLLLMMIIAHGSRIGETRKARWRNISFTRKQWVIPKEDAKNREEMVYPLSDSMVELLHSYREWQIRLGYDGDYLFPVSLNENKPAYGVIACSWVRAVSHKAWSAHDLRKRARSTWQDIGVDYLVAETLLNHTRDKLDQAYIHTHMELQKKEALSTYHEWLKSCWRTCFRPVSIDPKIV